MQKAQNFFFNFMNWTSSNSKTFFPLSLPLPGMGEMMWKNIPDKELVFRIYEELSQLKKNKNNPFLKIGKRFE